MKDYIQFQKRIWTHWVWYAWILFTLVIVWPVPSWPLFIAITVGYALLLPLFAMIERYYQDLDKKAE